MDFEECITFANTVLICSIGTAEGDQPHVRMFGIWFADKDGFYLTTPKTGGTYQQLMENPKLELCFYAPPPSLEGQTMDLGTEMRVTGVAEFIDDPSMMARLRSERPYTSENTALFRVSKGEAWFWTLADSGRESEIERVRF